MPASSIDRFSNNTGHNGVFSGPVVNATLPNQRNLLMQRISRQARRLRGNASPTNALVAAQVGRSDALEQLTVRLGTIPVVTYPNATSLTGTLQAYPADRPAATETISVTGPTAAATFAPAGPAQSVAFAAGGVNQALAATDNSDASAKGRALIDIAP